MEKSIIDIIRDRRSVRTFDGRPLSEEDRLKLEGLFALSDNPFGVPVDFRFLFDKELTSPVIVGTDCYVAAKVNRSKMPEIAFGYSFEKFCLLAAGMGIGTVILAGTLGRGDFEEAIEVAYDEVMPAATPVGYPAKKMSLRERIMRKAVGADKRLPFEELFFDRTFDKSLTPENAGKFKDALEMLRLAPSAVNKQPWRVVICDDCVHFYEKKNRALTNDLGDIQKVDIGIAIAHFDLTLSEAGISGSFVTEDPKLSDELEYIITYKVQA